MSRSWGMKTRAQHRYETSIMKSRGLSHPAEPAESGLWRIECERPGCEETFLTYARQRRYCSAPCRRQVEEVATRRNRRVAALVLQQCAADTCRALFLPAHAQHRFCFPSCRLRGWRETTNLTVLRCGWCAAQLDPSRSKRARYCNASCRQRAHRATQARKDTHAC